MSQANATIAPAAKSTENEQSSCCSTRQKRRSFFAPTLQAKLEVNPPNDAFEQEADTVADRVANDGEPQGFFTPATPGIQRVHHIIQRKCDHCEKEEKERLQRKSTENSTPAVTDSLNASIERSRGNGSSMDKSTQSFMEKRFDTNFSSVNIHTGGEAVQMSRDINAKAFTVGSDIYFNQGQYQPATSSGKHLLAHELTHVVQQTGKVQRAPGDEEEFTSQIPTSDKISDVKAFYDKAALKYVIKYYFIVKGNTLAIYDDAGNHKKTYNTQRPGIIDVKQYFIGDATNTGWGPVMTKKDGSFIALARPKDYDEEIAKATPKGVMYDAMAKELYIGNWLTESDWLDFKTVVVQNMPVGMAILDIPVYKTTKPTETKEGPVLSFDYPSWFSELKKKIEAQIDTERKTNRTNPNLPDRIFFYSSDKVQKTKGSDAWTIEVEKGKREAYLTVMKSAWEGAADKDAYTTEVVKQLYAKVKLMVDQADMSKEEEKDINEIDGTGQKQKGSKWGWAVKLKNQVNEFLTKQKLTEKEAKDFPDNLTLNVQEKDNEGQAYLRVWVYKNGKEVKPGEIPELLGGTLPLALKETDKPEDWVPIVRKAAAALKSGNVTTDPNATGTEKGQAGGDATVLPPYPAYIRPMDMNPDLTTASIASNNFRMVVDTAAVHGNNLLNLATIHMGLNIGFSWDVYTLPQELADLKNNPQIPQDHFMKTANEYPLKNASSLGTPQKTYDQDYDWEQKIKMKDVGEGSFLLTSKAAIGYPTDWNMKRQASVAGLPFVVKKAEDMASGAAMSETNAIEDLKKKAEKEQDPNKKKILQEQVKELEAREKTDLLTITRQDASQTEKLIKKAGELKKFIQDDKARNIKFEGDKSTDPFMFRLKAFDKELYTLYILVRQVFDYRYDDISAIDEYTKSLNQQLTELRKLEQRTIRMTDNPKLRKDLPLQRCVAALVKEDDGNLVPLILLVGHHKDSDPANGKYKMMVVDVTFDSPKKGDMTYAGDSKSSGDGKKSETTEGEAIRSAFIEFGEENKYGDGKIVYRVAGTNFHGNVDSVTTFTEYLGYALAAIGIALLIAGTIVSAGALAPATAAAIGTVVTVLGISTAVAGAILAGRNIYKRVEKGTFELDAEFALDVVAIVGAFVQVVGTTTRLMATLSRTVGAAQKLVTVQKLDKVLLIYDAVELGSTAVLIGLKVHEDIAAVKALGLPKEQEDEMMQQIALEAMQQGAMLAFASVSKVKDLGEHISAKIEGARYKSYKQKGWVDAEGHPTENAPPFLKAHATEPGKVNTKAKQGELAWKEAQVKDMAHSKTPDQAHDLTVTENGRIIRCSDFCTDMRLKYNEVLEKDPWINKEMADLETRAKDAAKSGNKEQAKKVADDAAVFEGKLKQADDLRKHLFGMTDKEVQDMVDSMETASEAGKVTGGEKSGHKIDDTRIPKKQRRQLDVSDLMTFEELKELGKAGYRKAMERINAVMGKKISDINELKAHWEAARKDVLKGKEPTDYTREQVIGMYKEAQRKFWANVRKDPAAVEFLKKQGFEFEGDSGAAMAVLGPGGQKVTDRGAVTNQERRISLDHIQEKAQGENWQKALDADNLELMFQNANSWKEIVQVKFGMRAATP